MLDDVADTTERPLFFGGLLRDLTAFSGTVVPRDIDVVVQSDDLDALQRRLGWAIKRRTRFGGLHLATSGWRIDVWPLAQTWAFRSGLVREATPEGLPYTTFLNVEAIALELNRNSSRKRRVFEHAFFESISSRILDINFEPNPFPELCVVRSLFTAAKLNFALSPRLMKYIDEHARVDSELRNVQMHHYGWIRRGPQDLDIWLREIREHLHHGLETPLRLDLALGTQLEIWAGVLSGNDDL